jgi:hypothetical protein
MNSFGTFSASQAGSETCGRLAALEAFAAGD